MILIMLCNTVELRSVIITNMESRASGIELVGVCVSSVGLEVNSL